LLLHQKLATMRGAMCTKSIRYAQELHMPPRSASDQSALSSEPSTLASLSEAERSGANDTCVRDERSSPEAGKRRSSASASQSVRLAKFGLGPKMAHSGACCHSIGGGACLTGRACLERVRCASSGTDVCMNMRSQLLAKQARMRTPSCLR
jgi:hypothetical protein